MTTVLPNFVSPSALLRKKYEDRKGDIVSASPNPVSTVCSSCWYQGMCIIRTLIRQPPRSCCVYELFADRGTSSCTVEELVKFTCNNRCVSRRKWVDDPCPHNENYCENHCPVSRFIRQEGPSTVPVMSDGY